MKRFIITAIILSAAFSAGAQDIYSAMGASETNYYGTARSMALGNAMTAMGGDLGSFGINPAGSAVSPFSQVTITPGLTSSSNYCWYAPTFDVQTGLGNADYGQTSTMGSKRFTMPNIGVSCYYETGRRTGIKGYTLAFVANTTNSYLEGMSAGGTNKETSMLGAMATNAEGYTYTDLRNGYGNLNSVVAYNSGMISPYGTYTDMYWGATETELQDADGNVFIGLAGPVSQRSSYTVRGTRTDMLINMAANIDDKWYVGFNIGLPMGSYHYSETFHEAAVNESDFPLDNTNFSNAVYAYALNRSISGIYAKVGVLGRVGKHLRLGFAAQTPSILTVEEVYRVSASTSYTNNKTDSASESSDYAYTLTTPYILDFGLAYTMGRILFTMDYEMQDYSSMRFGAYYDDDNTNFSRVNNISRTFMGVANAWRFGIEYRLSPEFSARFGWGNTSSPMRSYTNDFGNNVTVDDYDAYYSEYQSGKYNLFNKSKVDATRYFTSFGVGYSSPGSFFADFAVRRTRYPQTTFMPYSDYIFDANGDIDVPSPTVKTERSLIDALVTIGWRF